MWEQKDIGTGRRLAVSDVHGCLDVLRKLLEEKVVLTTTDTLFLLGDYIDRGPHSAATLDYIIGLRNAGFQVYSLLGNHEAYLLDRASDFFSLRKWLTQNKSLDLLDANGLVAQRYVDFIRSMRFYEQTEGFYLVHAGFDFTAPNPFAAYDAMLWMRNFRADSVYVGNSRVVIGHTPTKLPEIMKSVAQGSQTLCIDGGCVFGGHLCCLNLDDLSLTAVANPKPFAVRG